MQKTLLGGLSLVVTLIQYGPYCWSVYKHQIKPHVFSYLIWGFGAGIIFIIQCIEKAGAGSWSMGLLAFNCFLVATLSYRTGTKYLMRKDWIALIGALSAIPIWICTSNPLCAVLIITAIDAFAFYPTFRKAYVYPQEESPKFYSLAVIQYALSLLAIENYNATTTLNPIFCAAVSAMFVIMLYWRKWHIKKK